MLNAESIRVRFFVFFRSFDSCKSRRLLSIFSNFLLQESMTSLLFLFFSLFSFSRESNNHIIFIDFHTDFYFYSVLLHYYDYDYYFHWKFFSPIFFSFHSIPYNKTVTFYFIFCCCWIFLLLFFIISLWFFSLSSLIIAEAV